jgi:hypothetical protein
LFHDAHIGGSKRRALPLKTLERHCGSWVTRRPLKLATLHAPDLARFSMTLDQLCATNSIYYPQTARWAEAIHNNHPQVEGLEWTSYRASPDRAYVLFGDRVASSDLVASGDEAFIRSDPVLFKLALDCGQRVGVRFHHPRLR